MSKNELVRGFWTLELTSLGDGPCTISPEMEGHIKIDPSMDGSAYSGDIFIMGPGYDSFGTICGFEANSSLADDVMEFKMQWNTGGPHAPPIGGLVIGRATSS